MEDESSYDRFIRHLSADTGVPEVKIEAFFEPFEEIEYTAEILERLLRERDEDFSSHPDRVNFVIKQIDDTEFLQAIIKRGIVTGISDLEPPSDYGCTNIDLNIEIEVFVEVYAEAVVKTFINETDEEFLAAYQQRFERGLESFQQDDPYGSIFLFLSLQDGLMQWLCKQADAPKNGNGNYNISTKRNVLADSYRRATRSGADVSLLNTDEFLRNLHTFSRHRNAIVHGDPEATFDMDIATVSLLFLSLTFQAVVYELTVD